MNPGIVINTNSSHYSVYQDLEKKYKSAMYKIAPDPRENRARMQLVWQKMIYEENCLGSEIAQLILDCGTQIVDEKASDPEAYKYLSAYVFWIKKPEDVLHVEDQYIQKRELIWGLGELLVKRLVKNIPLPPKNKAGSPDKH